MIKYLLILINLIGLIGFKVLYPGGVSIDSDLPGKMDAGEEAIITVNINKGDLSGFAKFTQALPKGFSATLIEGSDATFSFKDQKVKFIWVALPAQESFSFSYKIKVDAGVSGNFKIGGTFSYIFDNEKQAADLDVKNVVVGEGGPSVSATPPPAFKGQVKEDLTEVKTLRTTSPIPGMQNTFKVELRINKPDVVGFAKIEESIPEGFYASEMESKGGIFSYQNQLLKIIWMSVPEEDQYIVSYKLTARDDVSGNQKIIGAFSYLKGDETQKYFVHASTIFIEKEEGDLIPTIIISDDGGNFTEHEQVTPEPEPEEEIVVAEPEPEPTPEPEPEPIEEIVSVPDPQHNVTYRVQVAAGHAPVEYDYFNKKFNLSEDINTENHQGWIKYTFGSYDVYKDCRDRRVKVWNENKITDAFVTAYNAGQRITVQEALMITNQKWYN